MPAQEEQKSCINTHTWALEKFAQSNYSMTNHRHCGSWSTNVWHKRIQRKVWRAPPTCLVLAHHVHIQEHRCEEGDHVLVKVFPDASFVCAQIQYRQKWQW